MSKPQDTQLLIPASQTWQVWIGGKDGLFTLDRESDSFSAADVDKLPKAGLTMAFPVRRITALPFRTPATDEAVHAELAELHAEQMGFRPDPDAGDLFDVFHVASSEDSTVLLPVVLAPPEPGSMPLRSPGAFDVSARMFQLPNGAVAIWRELGRWVFAIGQGEEVLYFQGLTEGALDGAAAREIRLAMAQLGLQGCLSSFTRAVIWHDVGESAQQVPDEFANTLALPIETLEKPAPRIPEVPSKLLPDDIIAARYEKAKKRSITLTIAAVLLGLLGLAAYSGFQLYKTEEAASAAMAELQLLRPQAAGLSDHLAKWDELAPVTDQDSWPVELLYRAIRAIPKNGRGLRLEEATVDNRIIVLKGDGEQQDVVSSFDLQLRRSALLRDYVWDTPAPTQAKSGRWRFIFTGTPSDLAEAAPL